ncbi:MAG: type II toxin-antitoxin system prevent-host-death family antitoxin [candidate division Zixibacteria bacterium]|nr:type II toxin-antitoxin system prevent-host-death family antitoxin [candidate division Zixibacteria bacterium]
MQTFRIGVREAKVRLSKLLRRVQEGHTVVITDRGRPVGKLIPVDDNSLSLSDRVRNLENLGWIEPVSGAKERKLPPPLPCPKNLSIQDLLQEDRNR